MNRLSKKPAPREPGMGVTWIVLLVIGLILWIFMAYYYLMFKLFASWDQRALFGDSFGALNALISGLTLAGLVATLSLQIREVRLQSQELQLQRREIAEQSDQLQRQAMLLVLSTYLQSRSETRATFDNSVPSDRAKERIIKTNILCSLMVDEIIQKINLDAELEEEIRRSRPPNLENTQKKSGRSSAQNERLTTVNSQKTSAP